MKCAANFPVLLLLLLLPTLGPLWTQRQTNAGEPQAYPIDRAHYLDPQQYRFLQHTLRGVEVVSLSESIHLTDEFPLVRLGMLQFLNENMGVHLLAFEGSAVDLWATQDRLLASKRTDADIAAAQEGLFGIWNTPEMRRVFEYEVASWKSATPLYITAYDIQPGTGKGTPGRESFSLLAERLRAYAAPPAGFDADSWIGAMEPLTGACSNYRPEKDAAIELGIAVLEDWIANAAPAVQTRYGNLPHAAVLRLVPQNLRASLELCRGVERQSGGSFSLRSATAHEYKTTRDTNAAAFALKLKSVAPSGKLMLWAHISHLFYDSERQNTSVGELLHETLGPKLYTLATFAEGGGTIVIFSDVNDQLGYAPVFGAFGQLRQRVNALCPHDCFLDLRGTQDPAFIAPHLVWFESLPRPMSLARGFDGIVWIKHVHAPQLPLGEFLVLSTLSYRKPPAVYFFLGFLVLVAAAILLLRTRRRRTLPGSQF